MNKRLTRAKQLLADGAFLVIVNAAGELRYNEHGIKSLLTIEPGSLTGAFVADKIVGKAAAMLLIRGGTLEVYAETISRPALETLQKKHVICVYENLVDFIQNRDGTGLCPMEESVLNIDDPQAAYKILAKKAGIIPD